MGRKQDKDRQPASGFAALSRRQQDVAIETERRTIRESEAFLASPRAKRDKQSARNAEHNLKTAKSTLRKWLG